MSGIEPDVVWVDLETLERFMVDVFVGIGVPEEEARVCADVLITADKWGIDSHDVNRLKTAYNDRIRVEIQSPVTEFDMVKEGATTAVEGHHARAKGLIRGRYPPLPIMS